MGSNGTSYNTTVDSWNYQNLGDALGGGLGSVMGGFQGQLNEKMGLGVKYNTPVFKDSDSYMSDLQGYQTAAGQSAANQAALADALKKQMSGEGPNPAQQMLNQATNRNIQQGTGMISSQKGINPALAARLSQQQSAAANQQAAGQGALMNAQQQLAAQQQLQGLYNQMAGQNIAQQQLAEQRAARQAQNYYAAQGMNLDVAKANSAQKGTMFGGLMQGGGSALAALANQGGVVGGEANKEGDHPDNDTVPALLSPGEIVIPRSKAKDADKAKEFIDHVKGKVSKEEPKSYGELLKAHKSISKRLEDIEKQLKGKKGA